jgi:hypothetical protein
MTQRTSACVSICLLAICGLTGCGKTQVKGISQSDLVGVWVEDASGKRKEGSAGQTIVQNVTFLRRLEINADGGYKFTICDTKGKPLSPAEFVEGRWASKETGIGFTAGNTQLGTGHNDYDPLALISLGLKSKGQPEDFLQIRDSNGLKSRYVRAEGQ